MKILLATFWNIPHVGGVWNYMQQLCDKLESLGHQVDLLGFGNDYNQIHILNKNIRIVREEIEAFLNTKITEQAYPEMYVNPLVERIERQRYIFELSVAYLGLDKYDIIHTQDVISTASIDRIKPEQTPLVATLHSSGVHEIRQQLQKNNEAATFHITKEYFDTLEEIGIKSPEVVIVTNNILKQTFMKEFEVPHEQLKVLHYGVDVKDFLEKMNKKSVISRPENKKVIIYTGRLIHEKGVHHLIDALRQLKKVRNDWVCWIIGTGEKEKELREQTQALGLDEIVTFWGNRDDLPCLLHLSNIFVLPSLSENETLSVIKAQLAGLAVIVSDAGVLPEVVENQVTGLISPAGNVEELFNHLNMLLENYKFRNRLSIKAKNWVKANRDIEFTAQTILNIYENAISNKQTPQ